MDAEASSVRSRPVLPYINPLPRSEDQARVVYGDGQVNGRQRGAHVCRHVIVTFAGVVEDGIAVWGESGENPLEVALNFGISVFLNQKGCRSMPDQQRR